MKRKIIHSLIVTISCTLTINIYIMLTHKKIDHLTSLMLAAFSSTIFMILLDYLVFDLPLSIYYLRVFYDDRAKAEGYYVMKMPNHPKRYIGLASIRYLYSEKEWIYQGYVFSSKNKSIVGSWRSQELHKTNLVARFSYFFTSFYFENDEVSSESCGWLSFNIPKNSRELYSQGEDFFYRLKNNKFKIYNASLIRINKKEIKRAIGKNQIKTKDEVSKFIIKYYKL